MSIFARYFILKARTSLLIALLFMASPDSANAASWSATAKVYDAEDKLICDYTMPLNEFLKAPAFGMELPPSCTSIMISGELESGDISIIGDMEMFYKNNPKVPKPVIVFVNSYGGSLLSALVIASKLRDPQSALFNSMVFVKKNDHCYSACVYILAAGLRRGVAGEVGVHRPRFVGDEYVEMGYQSLEEAYEKLYIHTEEMFKRWHVSSRLVDLLWSTSSSDIKILSGSELKELGLDGDDYILEEKRNLQLIDSCGPNGPKWFQDYFKKYDECLSDDNKSSAECSESLKDHPFSKCS
ncbi:MAG: hypothetical protein HQK87_01725 [Nitrospinae bacterium]|nr:hypothetical protein [Nitrospinota bacterium]